MEFEEQKEVVNPQNGEKIAVKRKKFWLEWRFWLWSAIAFMLLIVSVSSMVTACSAIGASSSDRGTSYVERQKREAYYYEDHVLDYGEDPGKVYNYYATMWFRYGNQDHLIYYDSFGTLGNVPSFQIKPNYEIDDDSVVAVYEDGVFLDVYEIHYGSFTESIPCDPNSYYWVFAYNGYDKGFSDGVSVGSYFDSISAPSQGVSLYPLNSTFADWWITDSGFMYLAYDVFTYSYNGSDITAGMYARYEVSTQHWQIYALTDVPHDYNYPANIANRVVGYWYVDALSPDMAYTASVVTYSFPLAYVQSVANSVFFQRYFVLGGQETAARGYQDGYADGYDIGREYGYTVGFVDGANSVDPDSLTNTLVAVFQQPFNQIYRFFNFNILGLNILGLVTGILSVFVVIKVLKKVL